MDRNLKVNKAKPREDSSRGNRSGGGNGRFSRGGRYKRLTRKE